MNFIVLCITLCEVLGENCFFMPDVAERNIINGKSIIKAVSFMQDLCLRSKF